MSRSYTSSLTCRKILLNGANGFTSSQKEVVLRIFIALKNPSSSAGFEPANSGSNGKHANHYTTKETSSDNDSSLDSLVALYNALIPSKLRMPLSWGISSH
jgi:hypothetical protein